VFGAILRSHAMRYGGVDVASGEAGLAGGAGIAGGAIWLPPGHWAPTAGQQGRSAAHRHVALPPRVIRGGER
jgi:hypothetical protein